MPGKNAASPPEAYPLEVKFQVQLLQVRIFPHHHYCTAALVTCSLGFVLYAGHRGASFNGFRINFPNS